MKVTIVIPTYNEKESLPKLIEELISEFKEISQEFFIIIIDDGSPDGTGRIADGLKKLHSNITVIHREGKLGLGSAYKIGFKTALEKFDPDFIIQMDADYSHDPTEIKFMLQNIGDNYYAVASRHVSQSSIIGWNKKRKVIHLIAGFLARQCARIKIKDPTSGFRLFRNEALQKIDFDKIKSEGFAFQVELLSYLQKEGLVGIEVPTKFINRKEGKSKMGFNEILEFSKMCLNLLLNR